MTGDSDRGSDGKTRKRSIQKPQEKLKERDGHASRSERNTKNVR